jgi:hypothetical protein
MISSAINGTPIITSREIDFRLLSPNNNNVVWLSRNQ